MKQLKLLFETDDLLPLPAALGEMLLQLLYINMVKQRQRDRQLHVLRWRFFSFSMCTFQL